MNFFNKMNVKFLSVISYIGPLFIVGKFSFEKDCEQVKFHTKQGEFLFYIMFSLSLISSLLNYALSSLVESLGIICFLVNIGIGVTWIILSIMGIISAFSGTKVNLPIVINFVNKINKEG